MALTPEDVVNKRFQPTKFREGYDQDEVDDFLDEVVVELRRLGHENEELRQRLIASDSRISELQRSGAQTASTPVVSEAALPTPSVVSAPIPAVEQVPEIPEVVSTPEPVAAVSPEEVSTDTNSFDPSNTNNLLQLARRLHEEHVREGVEKRDALIADGQSTAEQAVSEAQAAAAKALADSEALAAKTVSEAEAAAAKSLSESEAEAAATIAESQAKADQLLADAETQQRIQLTALEQERTQLEHRIDDLRTFEREYRQKLKSYIEGQLRDLDANSAVPANAPGSAPGSVPTAGFGSTPTPPANYPGFASS